MKISLEPPLSYKKVVLEETIITDELEPCKPKIIKERQGLKKLFRTKRKYIHWNETYGTIDFREEE
jgi:hypothetical protein